MQFSSGKKTPFIISSFVLNFVLGFNINSKHWCQRMDDLDIMMFKSWLRSRRSATWCSTSRFVWWVSRGGEEGRNLKPSEAVKFQKWGGSSLIHRNDKYMPSVRTVLYKKPLLYSTLHFSTNQFSSLFYTLKSTEVRWNTSFTCLRAACHSRFHQTCYFIMATKGLRLNRCLKVTSAPRSATMSTIASFKIPSVSNEPNVKHCTCVTGNTNY